jgi:hypothetical protein
MKIYSNHPTPPTIGSEIIKKYTSPWNIAVDYEVDMSFSVKEIGTMLSDYVNTTGNHIDVPAFSEKLHAWTSGYPFLVCKLCKMIDEKFLPERESQNWELADLDEAIVILLKETNTLFEDVAKNLQNHKEVADLVESIICGEEVTYAILNPAVNFAYMYGMIQKNGGNKIRIHNRIFEAIMTEHFTTKRTLAGTDITSKISERYIRNDGTLDFEMVLLKFQETIKEKYNSNDYLKDDKFLHNEVRMLFMVFLKPILNGIGFTFKEVQTGPEKRMDVVVIFKSQKFVVEMKIWRGETEHKKGIEQLKGYMISESVDQGYMLIFDKNRNKEFVCEMEDEILCVYI